jgi:hypothetical protein
MNQQWTYAIFRAKAAVSDTGTDIGSQDSVYGATTPYGCYTYRNANATSVTGSSPQGVLLTQP